MKLSRIFEHLTYNTLANLSLGGLDAGAVNLNDYPRLITITNAGMLDLYTRFNLRTREIALKYQEGQTLYPLTIDYAESNSSSALTKYIIDGTVTHPFTDNIIAIDNVYDELGEDIPLNDVTEKCSVFTPSVTELLSPCSNGTNTIILMYRATPDIIDIATTDLTSIEVDLPYTFMDAITSFIAWKIYTPIDQGESAKGNIHRANYLAAVQLLNTTNSIIQEAHANQRFGENGWV